MQDVLKTDVSVEVAADAIWDALRLEACNTGLKAQRIVLVHKSDIVKAVKRLQNHELLPSTTKES